MVGCVCERSKLVKVLKVVPSIGPLWVVEKISSSGTPVPGSRSRLAAVPEPRAYDYVGGEG